MAHTQYLKQQNFKHLIDSEILTRPGNASGMGSVYPAYTLNHIETVWLNKSQGFYNMRYILECMLIGSRVDKYIQYQFNFEFHIGVQIHMINFRTFINQIVL